MMTDIQAGHERPTRNHGRLFSRRMAEIAGFMACLAVFPAIALAGQPTLQDISKSFDTKLSQKPDSGSLLAIVLGIVAVVCIVVIASYMGRRKEAPKPLNHAGRLLREMRRKIHLTGPQMKRLKVLSQRKGCDSPLTLLLCPSMLAKKAPEPAKKT